MNRLLRLASLLAASCILLNPHPARAVPCASGDVPFCAYYLLPDGFHNLFDTHRITFDTLPNGQPSVPGTQITPSFNWTNQGVTFTPHVGALTVVQSLESPFFALHAANVGVPDTLPNWIEASVQPRVIAVGVTTPGITRLYAYDAANNLLGSALTGFYSQSLAFVGVASDSPIDHLKVDRGSNGEALYEFQFTAIPEPATVALLAAAAMIACPRSPDARVKKTRILS